MPEQRFEQNLERPVASPETGVNSAWERSIDNTEPVKQDELHVVAPVMPPAPSAPITPKQTLYKDARLIEIENILEQDLAEIYVELPAESKRIFKIEGEQTARKINSLLSESKIVAQKIIDLIVRWLSVLPGVNKFFVEQEAKIKTDKIIAMR